MTSSVVRITVGISISIIKIIAVMLMFVMVSYFLMVR